MKKTTIFLLVISTISLFTLLIWEPVVRNDIEIVNLPNATYLVQEVFDNGVFNQEYNTHEYTYDLKEIVTKKLYRAHTVCYPGEICTKGSLLTTDQSNRFEKTYEEKPGTQVKKVHMLDLPSGSTYTVISIVVDAFNEQMEYVTYRLKNTQTDEVLDIRTSAPIGKFLFSEGMKVQMSYPPEKGLVRIK